MLFLYSQNDACVFKLTSSATPPLNRGRKDHRIPVANPDYWARAASCGALSKHPLECP